MGKNKKKLLILGSGGFVLGNFIRRSFHEKKPYSIASLDRVRDSYILHNIYVNKDHAFYIADILDPHILKVIFETERPDIVIHGAEESFEKKYGKDLVNSNVVGTQNVIDACFYSGIERLIYCSVDQVYGQLTSEKEKSWIETDGINPLNCYAATKASGELLVRAAHERHGLQYQIARSCNNYGPWQNSQELIPRIIKLILANKKIPIYQMGAQVRDWLHVWDNCSALFKIIDEGDINTTYNIAAEQEYKTIEVFQLICNTLGKGHDLIEFEDVFEHSGFGPGFRYSMDSTKLRNLGWKPQFKFKDGLIQTCQWYLNNKFFLQQKDE